MRGGERSVAVGLGTEGDGHHPVTACVLIHRQRARERGAQGRVRVIGPVVGPPSSSQLQRRHEGAVQELALVGEVVGEGAGGQACLGGDVAQRCGTEACPGDEARCRVGELLTPFVDVDDLRH